MADIKTNLNAILSQIPENVQLVAVSKTKPNEDIMEAYEAGQRVFGENKAQDLVTKFDTLPKDIEWHYIGHLQTNKVKYLAPFVHTVEAVDSIKLLKEINKKAKSHNRVINCFLQFHIATEESKFGYSYKEVEELLNSEAYKAFEHIQIAGVMGMGTFTDDMEAVRKEFKTLKGYFDQLKKDFFSDDENFKEISMGMSNDFAVAIEEGSTQVRIGSDIFGARNY